MNVVLITIILGTIMIITWLTLIIVPKIQTFKPTNKFNISLIMIISLFIIAFIAFCEYLQS